MCLCDLRFFSPQVAFFCPIHVTVFLGLQGLGFFFECWTKAAECATQTFILQYEFVLASEDTGEQSSALV